MQVNTTPRVYCLVGIVEQHWALGRGRRDPETKVSLEYRHLLRARNKHSPPPKKSSLPIVSAAPAHVCSQQTEKPKCTSSCTITTSILNKITPAVPVWLMGCVWEQRHKDKLPAPPPAFHCCASYIGEEPPGELSQTWSPQEHTGAATAATYAYVFMSDARAN